jgi:ParB family chromosome partitioning protein
MEVKEIELELIDVSALNTRKDLIAGTEDSSIEDLANSIREKGLLQPITVRPSASGRYELIAGQRRLLAYRRLGLKTISAIVHAYSDPDAVAVSLIENVHRADMNAVDKARALKQLAEQYGDLDRVARETGWSLQTVKKHLVLLELPQEIQNKISTSEGPARVAALAAIAKTFEKPEDMVAAYNRISGFSQNIQLEILKEAGGDLSKLEGAAKEAQEGAFDTRVMTDEDILSVVERFLRQVRNSAGNTTIDEVLVFTQKERELALVIVAGDLDSDEDLKKAFEKPDSLKAIAKKLSKVR